MKGKVNTKLTTSIKASAPKLIKMKSDPRTRLVKKKQTPTMKGKGFII